MIEEKSRKLILTPRKSWLAYGAGLLVALAGTAALLHFDVLQGNPPEPPMQTTVEVPPDLVRPAPPTAETETRPELDAPYRRAVKAQIDQMEPPASEDVPPIPPPARVELRVVTVGATLNVRQRPGTDAPIIGSLEPGTHLQASARNVSRTWFRIHPTHREEPGWVFAALVEVVSGNPDALPTVNASSP